MTAPVLVKLGADGSRARYALLAEDQIAEVFSAVDDDAALAHARDAEAAVGCEPALAALARRRQAPIVELEAFDKMLKAHAALRSFESGTYAGVVHDAAMMDFLSAAYVFALAVAPDTRAQWHLGGSLRGTIIGTRFDERLFFLIVPGAEPKLFVLTHADACALVARDADVSEFDRVVVEFVREPGDRSAILEDAYGLTTLPLVTVVEDGRPRAPDDLAFERLAACLGVIGRHVAARAAGIFYQPQLGGEVDVKLATFTPDPA